MPLGAQSAQAVDHVAARTPLWIAVVTVAALFGFFAGYGVSSRSGVEPGYFDKPEAGGYGVAKGAGATQGMSEEHRKYYEELSK